MKLIESQNQSNKYSKVKTLLSLAHQIVWVSAAEIARGEQLEAFGFERLDALHLACAESGNADIFLTTDDSLLKIAKRVDLELHVRVEYPDTWLQEETGRQLPKPKDLGLCEAYTKRPLHRLNS